MERFEFLNIGLPRKILRRTSLPERDIGGFSHLGDESQNSSTEFRFGWGWWPCRCGCSYSERFHKYTCFLEKKEQRDDEPFRPSRKLSVVKPANTLTCGKQTGREREKPMAYRFASTQKKKGCLVILRWRAKRKLVCGDEEERKATHQEKACGRKSAPLVTGDPLPSSPLLRNMVGAKKRAASLALGRPLRALLALIVYAAARVSPRGITAYLQTV